MRFSPGEKRDPRELVDIEGSPCPNPTKFHPNMQESKQGQEETCMDEQGAPY